MFHKFARVLAFTNVLVAAVAVAFVATLSSVAGGLSPVAYQGAVATDAAISNAPQFPFGSCVPVHVAVGADAGHPKGTVEFSVDGVVVDRRALPAGGSFTELVGCCGSKLTTPLSVGTHHFAVNFIPDGNFAPSHATGKVVIVASNGSHGAPTCGGTPPPGVHAVDAGLPGTASAGGMNSLGVAMSGIAVALAVGVIAMYRRRRALVPTASHKQL